jgi:hypothetical protein
MSFANPTQLRLGMRANFGGKEYQLVGRSVLGESEGGGNYYWNEFNLETDSGEEATLVYEETENGAQWRIFTMFEPEYPITAADAASKRVGDRLNVTGEDVRITFRGSSRVYYVEGKAPEGEEVGTTAEYFNALAGEVMQVVSWTGDEVEFYSGQNLTPGMVASAFGLPQELGVGGGGRFSSFSRSGSGSYPGGSKFVIITVTIIVALFLMMGTNFSCTGDREGVPVQHLAAPARPLAIGATGTAFGKEYHVIAHSLVEVAEVGKDWRRHEYELTDENGSTALLVCGNDPGGAEWTFFAPFAPMQPPTANEFATKRVGDTVALDGYTGKVSEIFLSTLEQFDGSETDGSKRGDMTYGLLATNESRTLRCNWNEAGTQFYRGQTLSAKQAVAGFAPGK